MTLWYGGLGSCLLMRVSALITKFCIIRALSLSLSLVALRPVLDAIICRMNLTMQYFSGSNELLDI